jgi:hypothetical protein
MNQVFLKEARVALDCIQKNKLSVFRLCDKKVRHNELPVRTRTRHDVDIFPLHHHVNHLPRDRIPLLIEANSSAKVHFDLVDWAHDIIAIISSVLCHAIPSRSRLPSFGPPATPIDFPTLLVFASCLILSIRSRSLI